MAQRVTDVDSGRFKPLNVANAKIIPAVLARTASQARIYIKRLRRQHVPIHLDLMDGAFVSTRSFGPRALRMLRLPPSSEAHLMVAHPEAWIEACARANIHRLILHVESHLPRGFVRRLHRRFRLTAALKPSTTIKRIVPLVKYIHGVQVMTVHPGKQGRQFLKNQLLVVSTLRQRYPNLVISVDGGINEQTVHSAIAAGAQELIVGSAIASTQNPLMSYRRLLRLVRAQ